MVITRLQLQALESGFTLQLAGRTFAEDDIITTTAAVKKVSGYQSYQIVLHHFKWFINKCSKRNILRYSSSRTSSTTDDLTVGDDAGIGEVGSLSHRILH